MQLVSAGMSAGRGLLGLLLLDEFAFDGDLDLLADDHPAVQDGVETKPEVLPVDLGGGAIGDPVSHGRIVELPVLHQVEHYGSGGLLDGKVAGQLVVVWPGRLDARALEFDERVFVDLKEVRRLDVVVPDSVVGAEAGRGDGRLHRGGLGLFRVDVGDGADLIEVTSHRHHPKVLGGELDLRVIGVQLPVAHREPPCSPQSGRGTEYAASCDRSWRHRCRRYQVRLWSSRSWTRSPVVARLRSSPG